MHTLKDATLLLFLLLAALTVRIDRPGPSAATSGMLAPPVEASSLPSVEAWPAIRPSTPAQPRPEPKTVGRPNCLEQGVRSRC